METKIDTIKLSEPRPSEIPKLSETKKEYVPGKLSELELTFTCPSCGSDPDVDCICKGQNR